MALLEDAIDDWYQSSKKDYEIWASKHPVKMLENSMQIVQGQKAWCDMAEITKTPTFLVNGYKLPEPYYLEDIKYFI